ncbi:sodium-coupled monocarboxylate transporter 1-like [Styela clava]
MVMNHAAEDVEAEQFGVADFTAFAGLSLVSVVVGIYCAVRDRNTTTTENYYFGNRSMSPIPLGFSMAVSFISAITMMGTPVEVYLFGAVISWVVVGNIVAVTFACTYFVPLFYKLKISSVYEYLELRYDRKVRICCSSVSVIMMVFYMGFAIYIPALALNAVTPLDIKWTIVLTSLVCTFYTTLGGFKAVVWTDVVQSGVMFIGSLALLIQGIILVGGPTDVWDAINRGGRLNIFKVTFDPTIRSSLFSVLVGHSMLQSAATCTNQAMVQRVVSCNSVKNARKALIAFIFPSSIIFLLSVANGCVLYAYFEDCDPILSRKIAKHDQSIPYMMMKTFRHVPGMAGVFVAAACSGTLSTVSTGINSLSVIILHDYIFQIKKNLTPRQKLTMGKFCAIIIGCIVTVIAYITGHLGSTTIQIATSTFGAFGGPIFGVFLAGMFLPKTNVKGVLSGFVLGSILSLWMAIGAVLHGLSPEKAQMLPISTDACRVDGFINNTTTINNIHPTTIGNNAISEEIKHDRPHIADTFYSISFLYYGLFGASWTILITVIASYITGNNIPEKANPILFVPLIDNQKLPGKVLEFFRCGVPNADQYKIESKGSDTALVLLSKTNDDYINQRSYFAENES